MKKFIYPAVLITILLVAGCGTMDFWTAPLASTPGAAGPSRLDIILDHSDVALSWVEIAGVAFGIPALVGGARLARGGARKMKERRADKQAATLVNQTQMYRELARGEVVDTAKKEKKRGKRNT